MIRSRPFVGIIIGFCIFGCTWLPAQSNCRISGNYSHIPLQVVLDSISHSCGLTLSYDPAFISQQSIASLKLNQASLSEAIAKIEAQCQVRFSKLRAGEYAIASTAPLSGTLSPIRGTVYDAATSSPLPGAVVSLPATKQGAITDAQGKFEIAAKTTSGKIIVSYLGYYRDSTTYSAGKMLKSKFSLRAIPIEITGLLVSEESDLIFRNGSQGIAMSPRQLDAVAVLGEPDVFRTLQWLPGVSATEESSNGLFIRGGTPDQNLVLIDGIPVYNTGHFFGMFHAFNADALTRVNIQRSGFSSEFGGATSGLIDIDTKPRQLDSLEGAINLNFAATSAFISVPLAGKKVGLMLAGRRSYNDIFRSPLYQKIAGNVFQTGSIFRDSKQVKDKKNSDYGIDPLSNFYDIHAKLTAKLGKRNLLEASFYNGSDNVRYYFLLLDSNNSNRIRSGEEYLKLSNHVVGLRWHHAMSKDISFNTAGYFSSFGGNFYNYQTISDSTDTLTYYSEQYNSVNAVGLKSALHWKISPKHQLQTGLQITEFVTNFALNTVDQEYIWYDSLSLNGFVAAAYANHVYRPNEKLFLQPGLRATYYQADNVFFAEPRLYAKYKLGKGFELTANSGYYRQLLNPITVSNSLKLGTEFLTLSSRDRGLDATVAVQSNVGISYLAPGLWASADLYYKRLGGLQRYTRRFDKNVNANEIKGVLNDGDGQVFGIDLFLRGQYGPWSGWASYTLSDVTHRFDSINGGKRFQADFAQRHELKLVNVIKIKRWEWSLTWIYASGKPYSQATHIESLLDSKGQPYNELAFPNINNKRLPSYHRLDLNITYSIPLSRQTQIRTGISVFNLYDRYNIRDRNYSVQYPKNSGASLEIVRIDRELLGFSPNVFLSFTF